MVIVEPIGHKTVGGEGPHWDEEEQVLYFVDVLKGTVNKYNPTIKIQTSVKVGAQGTFPSIVVPVEGNPEKFVVTLGRSIALMTWDGKCRTPTKWETLCTVHDKDGERENRFNDGKVDPTGRLWVGTLGIFADLTDVKTKGSLFTFSNDWKPTTRLTDISCSNGMAWTPDLKTMYHIDTLSLSIDAYDFNAQTGDLSNRRVVFDFKTNNLHDVFADGMTIDTEGKLWVACFFGGRVIRVDPTTGTVLTTINVPSPQTTSVTFGGPNLDELYITTATILLSEEDLKKYPYAGYTFRVKDVGAKGFPGKNVQLVHE